MNSGAGLSDQKSLKSQNSLIGAGDQHSALMNEFKQAHKRMFRNGFKDSDTGENQVSYWRRIKCSFSIQICNSIGFQFKSDLRV